MFALLMMRQRYSSLHIIVLFSARGVSSRSVLSISIMIFLYIDLNPEFLNPQLIAVLTKRSPCLSVSAPTWMMGDCASSQSCWELVWSCCVAASLRSWRVTGWCHLPRKHGFFYQERAKEAKYFAWALSSYCRELEFWDSWKEGRTRSWYIC